MNNHRLCNMVFDTLSKSSIDKGSLARGDRVTFEYYSGRYALHHLHFRKAREQLLYAFNLCHIQCPQQQRSPLPRPHAHRSSRRMLTMQINFHIPRNSILTTRNFPLSPPPPQIPTCRDIHSHHPSCQTGKL
jgi:hypothetical protein